MSWGTLSFRSELLFRTMSFNFLLPDPWVVGPGPHPVFYLLHGYFGDHQDWLLKSRLVEHVGGLPLIVVMPDGENSFYCDAVQGLPFERYITEEVMGIVAQCFAAKKGRRARCIGGLSMGGYGAMKLGLKYPQLFTSIGAHSSAMNVARRKPDSGPISDNLLRLFGPHSKDNARRRDNDPFVLVERIDPKELPALYFDCGTEDHLIESNREFDAHLTRLEIPHEYREFPGGHTWPYWDEHIQGSLAFHCRALGIKRK